MPEEWDAATGQAALHPEDGGHGESALGDEAPLLHLSSWLRATHSRIIPIEHFFTEVRLPSVCRVCTFELNR